MFLFLQIIFFPLDFITEVLWEVDISGWNFPTSLIISTCLCWSSLVVVFFSPLCFVFSNAVIVSSILLQWRKINSLEHKLMWFFVIFLSLEFDDSPGNLDDAKENGSRKRYLTLHFVCSWDSYINRILYPLTISYIFYICFLLLALNFAASNLSCLSSYMISN